jgi:protein arginine kinase
MKGVRDLLQRPSIWLRLDGPESDVVLSSRIRFARNLDERPFPESAKPEVRAELLREILEVTRGVEAFQDELRLRLESLEPLERRLLGERQLVSQELVDSPADRGVVVAADESVSFMVNEEDHLRIQSFCSGLDLQRAYAAGEAVESALDKRLDFAFSETLGYLTACPTNTGTGMRASLLLHLPGLVLSNKIEKQLKQLQRRTVNVRGFHGEGSTAMGNFFQVSNAVTLGPNEEEILSQLQEVVHDLIAHERTARDELLSRARTLLEDRIWRSFGVLSHARTLNAQETLHHASVLRLGCNLRILDLPADLAHEILALGQDAHTEALADRDDGELQRGVWRADAIRKKLRGSQN